MVAEHITSLLHITPWIDQVWGYPRFPKGPKPWQDWDRIHRIRGARFDAVLNLNGSDRSSILTWLSGAPLRLGRCRSLTLKNRVMFTHPIVSLRGGTIVSQQHCAFIRSAGIVCSRLEYRITIPNQVRQSVAQLLNVPPDDCRRVIHISPFTTQDHKELPLNTLAAALNKLHRQRPELLMVLSCANNQRERDKLKLLLDQLDFAPHRTFAGTLNLVEMVAVLSMSRLHLGGDSGGLHVAVMTGTPSVSWFRRYEGATEWIPEGRQHRTLFGEVSEAGMEGIESESLVAASEALLNTKNPDEQMIAPSVRHSESQIERGRSNTLKRA